jgi:signal transduction histidine kinase
MASTSTAEDAGVLWLAAFQQAVGRASHDVKDALNGVSVNLEVVRSRAARENASASAVVQFAEAASQQLERLTSLVEAVLALGRPEREPVEVALTLRRIATLCGASGSFADAHVEVKQEGSDATTTSVRGDVVRLALMAPMLVMVAGTDRANRLSPVRCTLRSDATAVTVAMGAEGRRATMPDAVAEVVRAAGVRWGNEDGSTGRDFSLVFPRA